MALTAAGIIDDALRLIGVLSPYDTAAEPEHYDIGLRMFDLMVAQLAATKTIWFFDSGAVRIPLVEGQSSYDLDMLLQSDIQLIREATLISGVNRTPMRLIRQREYDERFSDTSNCIGEYQVYITRTSRPIMYVLPIPVGIEPVRYVELRGQGFSRDMTQNNGQVTHDFEKAWELMLGYGLAKLLGAGIIITVTAEKMNFIMNSYETMLHDLMTRPGRENVKQARFVKQRDF